MSYCTIVMSGQRLYQTITTGSIHDYLFCYCPLVGILFEVLRIVQGQGNHLFKKFILSSSGSQLSFLIFPALWIEPRSLAWLERGGLRHISWYKMAAKNVQGLPHKGGGDLILKTPIIVQQPRCHVWVSVQGHPGPDCIKRVQVHVWTKYLGLNLKMKPKVLYQSLDPKMWVHLNHFLTLICNTNIWGVNLVLNHLFSDPASFWYLDHNSKMEIVAVS